MTSFTLRMYQNLYRLGCLEHTPVAGFKGTSQYVLFVFIYSISFSHRAIPCFNKLELSELCGVRGGEKGELERGKGNGLD